ncbi:MAG: hypothetical protein R6T98_16980 [Desulfatiglandales bacterium]
MQRSRLIRCAIPISVSVVVFFLFSRLIQKIYEAGLLKSSKCSGKMKVISLIEDKDVTRLPRRARHSEVSAIFAITAK